MPREITQQPTDMMTQRKIMALILRNEEDFHSLRHGEFIGTSKGYCYRSNNETLPFYGRFEGKSPGELILLDTNPTGIENGLLLLEECKYMMKDFSNLDFRSQVNYYLINH